MKDRNGREISSATMPHVRHVVGKPGEDGATVLWVDGAIAHLEMDHAQIGGRACVADLVVVPKDRRECCDCACAHPDGVCMCGGEGPVGDTFRTHARAWPCDGCGYDVALSASAHPTMSQIYCGGDRCRCTE